MPYDMDDIGVRGQRGVALKWFHSFVTGRSQRVQISLDLNH